MSTHDKEFKILIIEDNPGDFMLLEEYLSEQMKSLVILQARNFREAAEILIPGLFKFDIILLDLSLPDKTCIPLIKEVVELSSNAPVIALTGYSDFEFGVKSLSLGIADYLIKEELTPTSLYKSIIYSSERKKTVSELEESEKKYSELFHLSPLPMFVFEAESLNFLDVNNSFNEHYGYTRDESLRMNLKDIKPPEEIPLLMELLSKDTGQKRNGNMGIHRHVKKNGQVIQVDIQSNFITYKGKKAKVTIATDMTERLNYIKAIEQQNEKLREISWIQSHIVRAPLARIMGLINIFKDMPGEALKQETLEYILLSANELDKVIKEITDKTRVAEDAPCTKQN